MAPQTRSRTADEGDKSIKGKRQKTEKQEDSVEPTVQRRKAGGSKSNSQHAANDKGPKSKRQKTEKQEDSAIASKPTQKGGKAGGNKTNGQNDSASNSRVQSSEIPFQKDKTIPCRLYKTPDDVDSSPALIFTHGAGGGITNAATVEFAEGFSVISPVLCYQGTMNLQSRVKACKAVIEDQKFAAVLGGRSMGARAAVVTALEQREDGDKSEGLRTDALILVSYPLENEKGESREGILLELPEDVDVLFVIGDRDTMCDLEKLRKVRQKMKAHSWIVTVKGADHGMSVRKKQAITAVRRKTGQVAAEWLKNKDHSNTSCYIEAADEDDGGAVVSEWSAEQT